MKNVNLQKILQLLMSNVETSDEVADLANYLIKDLQIQPGTGLAGFLKVDSKFDNYAAVRVWIKRRLPKIDTGDFEANYQVIKKEFLAIWP